MMKISLFEEEEQKMESDFSNDDSILLLGFGCV